MKRPCPARGCGARACRGPRPARDCAHPPRAEDRCGELVAAVPRYVWAGRVCVCPAAELCGRAHAGCRAAWAGQRLCPDGAAVSAPCNGAAFSAPRPVPTGLLLALLVLSKWGCFERSSSCPNGAASSAPCNGAAFSAPCPPWGCLERSLSSVGLLPALLVLRGAALSAPSFSPGLPWLAPSAIISSTITTTVITSITIIITTIRDSPSSSSTYLLKFISSPSHHHTRPHRVVRPLSGSPAIHPPVAVVVPSRAHRPLRGALPPRGAIARCRSPCAASCPPRPAAARWKSSSRIVCVAPP